MNLIPFLPFLATGSKSDDPGAAFQRNNSLIFATCFVAPAGAYATNGCD